MIHDNVKSIRVAKGINASHIARVLGITPPGYYYIEGGQTDLSAERLKILAELLGEEVRIFFDEKLTQSVIKRIELGGRANERTNAT